jgi:hypothetical protein
MQEAAAAPTECPMLLFTVPITRADDLRRRLKFNVPGSRFNVRSEDEVLGPGTTESPSKL